MKSYNLGLKAIQNEQMKEISGALLINIVTFSPTSCWSLLPAAAVNDKVVDEVIGFEQ